MAREVKVLQRCDDPRDPHWEDVGLLICDDDRVELKPLAGMDVEAPSLPTSDPLVDVVEDLDTGNLAWKRMAPSDPECLEALAAQLGWRYRLAPADQNLSPA